MFGTGIGRPFIFIAGLRHRAMVAHLALNGPMLFYGSTSNKVCSHPQARRPWLHSARKNAPITSDMQATL
jgi:hypothetical protein